MVEGAKDAAEHTFGTTNGFFANDVGLIRHFKQILKDPLLFHVVFFEFLNSYEQRVSSL